MAGLLDELVSGVVDAALKEVLKKTGVRSASTRRTRRRKASGGLLADVIEAVLKPEKKPAAKSHIHQARGGAQVKLPETGPMAEMLKKMFANKEK